MRSPILVSCLIAFAAAACSEKRADPVSEAAAPDRPAVPVPSPIAAGRYCAVEDVDGLGQAVAEATVSGAGDNLTLTFTSAMPDSPQTLEVGPEPAEVDSDGKVVVSFEDGWNNRGLATLAPSGALALQIVTPSPDQASANVRRTYGDFQLTKEACADIRPIG